MISIPPTKGICLRFRLTLILGLAALCAVLSGAFADAGAGGVVLSAAKFPATGVHEAILTVTDFGRYEIAASSAQGTALQLVDRMAGPGEVFGAPGSADGRIDAFLERGQYKVRLISDAHGTGTVALAVTPFVELQPSPVQLVEQKPVLTQLGDDQQRSWWVVIPSQGSYDFEAGGRYLNDLRLWRDGSWMVNAAPVDAVSDADPGRPLALRQLAATLQPGLYRLTAYGGAPVPWANGGTDAPLELRWGFESLADSGRTVHVASRLGIERFLVPATASDVRLVLDAPGAASLAAVAFDPTNPYDESQAQLATISKSSRDPVAELQLASGAQASDSQASGAQTPWLVTVTRQPGKKFRLDVFNNAGASANLSAGINNDLLAVTLPGEPDDEIDPAFLLEDNNSQRVVAASVIDLDTALPWRRKFNLIDPVQTFLYADKNIDLRIDGAGARAEFTVARYFDDGGTAPEPKGSGGVWTLTPGYYVLTAAPQDNGRGVLTMSMYAAGTAAPARDSARLAAPVFRNLQLNGADSYTLETSLADGTPFGVRLENLPAALAQPLTFETAPGKTVEFQVVFSEPEQLAVTDEASEGVGFSLDGVNQNGTVTVAAGQHQFSVTGPGPGDTVLEVAATPTRLLPATALPAIPVASTAPPVLPKIVPGRPDFVDLARGESVTFGLPVAADALYRFETTGLLETGGAIRTRTNPSLASVEGNGIGRNFLLQQFLREGDYQLTVTAQGQTEGHVGVSVAQAPLVDEGFLAPGQPARMTLEPGEAALYRFHLPAAGTYHIFTLGLGHQFAMRLEDADGWPLIPPGGAADATMDFSAGDYRMILLPGTVENRAVTMLQPILPPVVRSGHGPFAVSFGEEMSNRWLEPAAGAARTPDSWTFSLPAPATVTVSINAGMAATLAPAGGAAMVTTGTSWTGALAAGDYVITAVAAAPDNRVDYSLRVDTAELLAGQSRDVTAPVKIPVSLGGGETEISSFGDQDVAAALYDSAGRLVAADDDRDNDWNFLIAGNFAAGRYTLAVDPVGADSAETTVSVSSPEQVAGPALALGGSQKFADGLVHVMAVPAAADGQILLAAASAAVPVGLTLEAAPDFSHAVASASGMDPYVAVPGGRLAGYRLAVWAEDHGDTPITVSAAAAAPAAVSEGELASGVAMQAMALGGRTVGVLKLATPAPVILRPQSMGSLLWSSRPGVAVAQDSSGTVAADGADLWLVDRYPHQVRAPAAELTDGPVRVTLAAGQRLHLRLPAAPAGQPVSVWEALAQGAQPGVSVGADGAAPVMALAPASGILTGALAVQVAGQQNPELSLWQAAGPGGSLQLTVQRTGFAAPAAFSVRAGDNDGVLEANAAMQAGLQAGWKRLTLTLPAGAVAVFLRAGVPQSIVAADGGTPDVVETKADTLMLLNMTGNAAPFSVAMRSAELPSLALNSDGLLTRYSATPAILHVVIPEGYAGQLQIAGAANAVTAIDPSGMVTAGPNAEAAAGSQVALTVQPGPAVLAAGVPKPMNLPVTNISGPVDVALSGQATPVAIAPAGARLLHISAGVPLVLRELSGGAVRLFPAGVATDLFQPKQGILDVEFSALGGQSLDGDAHLDPIEPIPIADGLGPPMLVPPGEARLFTFTLTAPRTVGVGVRGSVDDATTRLLAADGTDLGSGVIHMHHLDPGTYFLTVEVPADAAATVVQPALVGVTLPDDGPPPDVQAAYESGQGAP